jgi:type I restriction enzyme R subunit
MPNMISEDEIELAVINLLNQEDFGYRHLNCYTSDAESLNDNSNRESKSEVLLIDVLKERAVLLNPEIPASVIFDAIDFFRSKRLQMSPIAANKEIHNLIKDGIPVEYEGRSGRKEQGHVKLICFDEKERNDFLLVSQLWIKGERRYRRPDLILYINGIPLVFIELKNSIIKLKQAYDKNLTDYKEDIPQLFLFNAFCILSNGVETKVGSFNAGWEFFFRWLRISDEKENVNTDTFRKDGTSLQQVIYSLFKKEQLLDYIENFIIFHNDSIKIIAQNHQFLGVNKTVESFRNRKEKQGRLGVFWHTQASGKSFSMIFFYRKIFRKFSGDFSFVVVTDRDDLDGQIYRNFLHTDTVKQKDAAQPKNSEQLRDFLAQNKRIVFTLIQKFRFDKGKEFPLLLDPTEKSREVIVIVDEAHRTQYKALAENMRKGLQGAHFLAFTGTPLLGKDRKTHKWFGDYVSEYSFKQAMDDEATVPLFYQKRVPEVLIQNADLDDEFYDILEGESITDAQKEKLEREFAQELHIIKRDDRLDTIAKDIAFHFPRRGFLGKAMVVSVDKFTCVRMYEKVQSQWHEEIRRLVGEKNQASDLAYREKLSRMIDFMRNVDMAVIVSEEADEEKKFAAQNLVIKPHRDRMSLIDGNGHDIEYRFKDPEDKLQIVFVCAMWLTGFDAPTVSTLYLDKPMKDHTLMQTIARANRVTSFTINGVSKRNGEIVDYYNVFRNMKKALADYAIGDKETPPVQDKSELIKLLDEAIRVGTEYCMSIGIDLNLVLESEGLFKNIELFKDYADKLMEKDEWRREFNVYQNTIESLYEACKPEIVSREERRPLIFVLQYLRGVIDGLVENVSPDEARKRITALLDQSVVTANEDEFASEGGKTQFSGIKTGKKLNFANIDFEKLGEEFKQTKYKNIEIANLRTFIQKKLDDLIQTNRSRLGFAQRFQEIIDRYNAGSSTAENFFDDLVKFAEGLNEEQTRSAKEGLSDDELEIFDLIKKEKMTREEEQKVKLAAKKLLEHLTLGKPKVLVQDWFKDSQTQKIVKSTIETVLDSNLPQTYDRQLFANKCTSVFELVFDYAAQGRKWAA